MRILNFFVDGLLGILLVVLHIVSVALILAMGLMLFALYVLLAKEFFYDTRSTLAGIAGVYAIVWFIIIFPGFQLIKFWANECEMDFAENIEDTTENIFYLSMFGGIVLTIFCLFF